MAADYEHKALQDYRRMNAAFTGACSKLIIVSSPKSFEEAPWLKYLKHRSYKVEICEHYLNPVLKYVEDVYSRLFRRRPG